MHCRLILDPPAPAHWQMAVDEALLASCAAGGGSSLRFYRWSEPTLSLGYFQRRDDRALHPASRKCPLVRRPTGGGAIVHDHELTYSLTLPAVHPLARRSEPLYAAVHDALVRVLARLGVDAHRLSSSEKTPGHPPFLCFERRAAGDLLIGSNKICGSAQRRLQGVILQHGSVLLERSACAPELPGIRESSGKLLADAELVEFWPQELAASLDLEIHRGGLSPLEAEQAGSLAQEKYGSPLWSGRR